MSCAPFAILASGTGSNALAIHDAVLAGAIVAPLACIVSDRADAPVLERGRERGIETVLVDRAAYDDRDTYEGVLVDELRLRGVEHVVLAGYMRICGPVFLEAFAGRAINLHPSLLPDFPGRDAIGDALDAGVTRSGVTVHFIDSGIDTGPVICQAAVDVRPDDTRDTLARRIHAVEHAVLPRVVAALVRGEIDSPFHHPVTMEVT